ncbi:voltage-gated hydrogen channel 1-like [Bradysia coprophila]|uniref:voltage-gated hydrogen channel 1-like n=1 Tax=Bradysia coprophila TaxID=38358 RepID=UPI00187DC9DE|nr:voltage-gated hydrogen channel 1-like [Bradysia coprophila]XP_037050759.1 voltage-gated hydrogen channel 1-like [Bradysia coprophila]XP_037050760.1 voltage-gated hydrogen channel 1-like [Bradysia coprophila]XP_037050761.1 voltage-gated hydrogen channel 1-like [Bradysia coprophila]XP_037050762.1 voltage-gated hydrogen channel 1-like [Bradysia coprophila]
MNTKEGTNVTSDLDNTKISTDDDSKNLEKDDASICKINVNDEQITTSDPLLNETKPLEKKLNGHGRRHSSFFNIPALHAQNDDSFRGKCFRLINSVNFQIVVIGFVILDCIFIIAELVIDLRITKDEMCDKVTCEPIKTDHSLSLTLQSISLAILTLFVIELLFKLYVLRLDFFKSKMEIFDYTIVVVSWSLDIVFFRHDEHAMNLLIFLRMWRLVRIIHAIAVSMRAPVEHQLEQEKDAHHVTEARLDKLFNYTKDLEKEVEELRNLLKNFVDTLPATNHRGIPMPTFSKKSKLRSSKEGKLK